MTVQKQFGFWIAALVVFILFLWLFSGILLPFVAGLALAYFLDPVAGRLQRLGFGRVGATLLILGVFVVLFVLFLVLAAPLVVREITAFLQMLPSYVTQLQRLAYEHGGPFLELFGGDAAGRDVESSIRDFVGQATGYLLTLIGTILAGGQTLLSLFSLVIVTPIIAFYLLIDWHKMVATVDSWLPLRYRETIRGLAREIDTALAGFVRGQAALCLILGSYYAIGLSMVGLNFGALIGITAGFLSIIPYVGSFTGLLLSVGVAIVQFWPDYTFVLITLAIFVSGQIVEGNILQPKMLGDSVGVHPVWLMFALFAFGSLFGFLGLLMAVPLAAAVGVLARFGLRRYLASSYYRGDSEPVAGPGKVARDD